SDAWIARTSDLPCGVVSRSRRICSRSPLVGPMPATVNARPGVICTLVDSTGCDEAGAPAPRMATVYSPAFTLSYREAVPEATWGGTGMGGAVTDRRRETC